MESNTKIFWFFVAMCFCITAPSCRALKKQFSKTTETEKTKSETIQTGKFTLTDSSRKDWSEEIEFNFSLHPDQFPGHGGKRAASQPKQDFGETPPGVTPEAWESLLARVKDLNIKIRRQQSDINYIHKDSTASIKQQIQTEKAREIVEKYKESNSTISANIPWYAWVIGSLLFFAIFAYGLKKLKPW